MNVPRLASSGLLLALLALPAAGQMPPVGIVDFYGLRHTTERQVREALQVREGTSLPEADEAARQMIEAAKQRVRAIPGVRDADISVVCCDAGRTIVYVGIVETGASVMKFSSAPLGTVRLAEDVVKAGDAFGEALQAAVMKGDAGEDDSRGHSLSSNAGVRAIQERFIAFARRDDARLRDVLAHSGNAEHRALAAQILGYAPDKKSVVAPLSEAMADPDENVRNNAMRALAVIAGYGEANRALGIRVRPEPFVDLLNSPFWTDRNKASFALTELTAGRDPQLLALLGDRALPSLLEMARWKSRMHAPMALVILGRMAGLSEEAVTKAIDANDREGIIAAAIARGK